MAAPEIYNATFLRHVLGDFIKRKNQAPQGHPHTRGS